MPERYDVVVVGLGVMGSAVAARLARDGQRVLGVERHWPAHARGASGGESRMLRRASPGYPEYAPLTAPARTAWLRLQADAGERLFLPTGGLLVGGPGSEMLRAAVTAARTAPDGVPHQTLTTSQLRRKYPQLMFGDGVEGFVDEEAGVLLAEPCVRALQRQAVEYGARLLFGALADVAHATARWEADRTLLVDGRPVGGRVLVLALGAWAAGTPGLWPPVTLERTVSHWLDPGPYATELAPGRLPFVEWDGAPGEADDDPDAPHEGEFCMLPALPGGVKAKAHHTGDPITPGSPPRAATPAERAAATERLARLTGLRLAHRTATASTYTNTADGRFVVARHPAAPGVVVVSACSGHGFKFAPLLADRAAQTVATVREDRLR